MAQSANSLTKVALSCPLAQRNNNLFARFDSATPSAFSKALLAFACFETPDSISSFHPLSRFAINKRTFSKDTTYNILFQRYHRYFLNLLCIQLEPKVQWVIDKPSQTKTRQTKTKPNQNPFKQSQDMPHCNKVKAEAPKTYHHQKTLLRVEKFRVPYRAIHPPIHVFAYLLLCKVHSLLGMLC